MTLTKNNRKFLAFLIIALAVFMPTGLCAQGLSFPEQEQESEEIMTEMSVVKLRSLDKVTARTMTFEANVGSTVKFGSLYIKAQSCRKSSPLEKPESASFLQVWEIDREDNAEWVFSGWMFASSPGLSSMDHPIYDVWVLDCLDKKTVQNEEDKSDAESRGEGELSEDQTPAEPVKSMGE